MTEDCVFCRIVAGEADASVAYEDEGTLAFMDLGQFNPGHTLVVPKRHVGDIFDLDDETGASLMAAVTRVARGVRQAFAPDGINLWQSNGAPWQEVFHVHVLPRWREDGVLRFSPPQRQRPARRELDEQAVKIREALQRDA
ncbi:MAG: HIT family protein [Dehalococcoidia bacterium]|nr:HIT family protein [Dehalococcoidia bacterium]